MPPADDADDPGAHGQCGGNRGGDTCGARCGRVRVVWRSLFLKPAAARRFIPFIRENFPGDEPRLTAFYGNSVYAPRAYDEHLRAIFDRLKRKYGFDPGLERDERKESEMAAPPASPPEPRRAVQLSLMSGARGGT